MNDYICVNISYYNDNGSLQKIAFLLYAPDNELIEHESKVAATDTHITELMLTELQRRTLKEYCLEIIPGPPNFTEDEDTVIYTYHAKKKQ